MKKTNNPPKKKWEDFTEVEFFNTIYPKMIEKSKWMYEKKGLSIIFILLGFFSIL